VLRQNKAEKEKRAVEMAKSYLPDNDNELLGL